MKEKKKERVLSRNRSFAGDLLQNNHWDGSRSTLTYNFHTRKRKEGRHKEKEVLINKYIIVTRESEKKEFDCNFHCLIKFLPFQFLIETLVFNREREKELRGQ
jgi:hypothetical protein